MNKNITNAIVLKLRKKIEVLNEERSDDMLQLAKRCYQEAKLALCELNAHFGEYPFEDQQEEIEFFKHIKPSICTEMQFYAELYYVEEKMSILMPEDMVAYLKAVLVNYQQYLDRNHVFYTYCRTGQTDLDAAYYTNNENSFVLPPEDGFDGAAEGCLRSVYCYKVARFKTIELLKELFQTMIFKLEHPELVSPGKPSSSITWTGHKADLVELGYALQLRGCISHGKASKRDVLNVLQAAFNVNVGNHTGIFNKNIRGRKKDHTKFLNDLSRSLKQGIDDNDIYPNYN